MPLETDLLRCFSPGLLLVIELPVFGANGEVAFVLTKGLVAVGSEYTIEDCFTPPWLLSFGASTVVFVFGGLTCDLDGAVVSSSLLSSPDEEE